MSLRSVFLLLLLLSGCSPVLFQYGTAVSPERKAWEAQVSTLLNQHEERIKKLEQPVNTPAP